MEIRCFFRLGGALAADEEDKIRCLFRLGGALAADEEDKIRCLFRLGGALAADEKDKIRRFFRLGGALAADKYEIPSSCSAARAPPRREAHPRPPTDCFGIIRRMKKRVAILMESSLEVSRQILSGIVKYMDRHEPWTIDFIPGALCEQRLPDNWRGDGIIARIPSPREAMRIAKNPAPKVIFDPLDRYLDSAHPLSVWPRIECDHTGCGATAADYFISMGFVNFAFIDVTPSAAPAMTTDQSWPSAANWRRLREAGYVTRLRQKGFDCSVYRLPINRREAFNANLEQPRMIRFIQNLPKPVAIFCPNDARGRQVTDACLTASIHVPYQVAILGVNDDSTICHFSQPPLSSIPLDAETAGRKAAIALAALMEGRRKIDNFRYRALPPVTRTSTMRLQTDDPVVISVLEAIRSAKGFSLRASELAREQSMSLRHLENKFQKAIGRSIADVLHETCLENVMKLVKGTDLSFRDIAAKAGHRSVSHLSGIFKSRYGITMSEVRAERSHG